MVLCIWINSITILAYETGGTSFYFEVDSHEGSVRGKLGGEEGGGGGDMEGD